MPTLHHIQSTLSHIISPCSLQPLPLLFSIAAIKIVAKNKAVLSIATGAPLHGFSMLPHTPIGALVAKDFCLVEQLNPGGAGVLTPTRHTLLPATCPLLQWGGKHLWEPTPSLPSLSPLNHQTSTTLLLLLILRRRKGWRGRRTRQRGRVLVLILFTLMMVAINMMMMMILSQPPMVRKGVGLPIAKRDCLTIVGRALDKCTHGSFHQFWWSSFSMCLACILSYTLTFPFDICLKWCSIDIVRATCCTCHPKKKPS
jgi:hypothetical protein